MDIENTHWSDEIETHKESILNMFASHNLPGWAQPEDVLQEVYLNLLTYGYPDDFGMSPQEVARTSGIRVIRKMIRKERGEAVDGPRVMLQVYENTLVTAGEECLYSIKLDLGAALSDLDEVTRTVVWRLYAEDYQRSEVAEFTGLAPHQVKYRARVGLDALKEALGGDEGYVRDFYRTVGVRSRPYDEDGFDGDDYTQVRLSSEGAGSAGTADKPDDVDKSLK